MTSFNLRKFVKKAFYEDSRGYMQNQTRSYQLCYKCKSDEGMAPQEAWEACQQEYNEASDKSDWAMKYAAPKEGGKRPRLDSKTPAVSDN